MLSYPQFLSAFDSLPTNYQNIGVETVYSFIENYARAKLLHM